MLRLIMMLQQLKHRYMHGIQIDDNADNTNERSSLVPTPPPTPTSSSSASMNGSSKSKNAFLLLTAVVVISTIIFISIYHYDVKARAMGYFNNEMHDHHVDHVVSNIHLNKCNCTCPTTTDSSSSTNSVNTIIASTAGSTSTPTTSSNDNMAKTDSSTTTKSRSSQLLDHNDDDMTHDGDDEDLGDYGDNHDDDDDTTTTLAIGITNSTCAELSYNDPRSLSCYHDLTSHHGITNVPKWTRARIHKMERTRPLLPGRRIYGDSYRWTILPDLTPLQIANQMTHHVGLSHRLAKKRTDLTKTANYREAYRIKRLQECIDIWLIHGNWTDVCLLSLAIQFGTTYLTERLIPCVLVDGIEIESIIMAMVI
jgi:hypothetical protein